MLYKIPHCRSNSNIKYQNRRKKKNRYIKHTNTLPLTLSWFLIGTSVIYDGVKLVLVYLFNMWYAIYFYFNHYENKFNTKTKIINEDMSMQ